MSENRALPKRAACDRCRVQKLRCIRIANHPTDACNRCVRSQLECISSSSKRPGRPRNSTSALRRSGESTPTSSNPSTVQSGSPITNVDIQPLEDLEWFNLDILDSNYDIDPASWATMDTIFSGDSATIDTPTLQNQARICTDTSANDVFTGLIQKESFPIQTQPETCTNPRAIHRRSSSLDLDPSVQLAILQRDLSIQAFALKSVPWDIARAMRVTSTADSGAPSPDQITDYNPLAKIVMTTKDFAAFLRTLQHSLEQHTRDIQSGSASSLSHSSLSVTDVLTVLSCHMLTLSIYETIFSYFLERAAQDPELAKVLLQSTPQLFVGGIPVPPRLDMLGHLFYSLAGSLLQPIETLLGLPDDFCVSLQQDRAGDDNGTGIFSGPSGRLLFSTLLKMEENRMEDGNGGPGVIASLKEKIKRVQGLA